MDKRVVNRLHRKKPQPAKITETQIKGIIKQYLSLKGWFHFYLLAGMACYPGAPDIIAIKDGITLYLEIKTFTGKLSDHQIEFQTNIEKHGGKYLVIRGIDDLIQEGI